MCGMRNIPAWGVPPSRLITLPSSTIHLWKAYLGDTATKSLIGTDLTLPEINSKKPVISKIGRAVLRNVLSRYTGIPSRAIILRRDFRGKPYAASLPHQLQFNIAHTNDIFIMAIADNEVGVDIERINRTPININRLLKKFTPSEASFVQNAPDPNTAFLRLWTRKEAFLKCTGEGIRGGLASFEVSLDDEMDWLKCVDGNERAASSYWTRTVKVEASPPSNDSLHIGALVYKGQQACVKEMTWRPE